MSDREEWKGIDPKRSNLTGQPRREYTMTDREAVGVMDEVALRRSSLTNAGQTIAEAWLRGDAQVRDYAHCGGRDSRMHMTVVDMRTRRAYHVPVSSHQAGQWNYELYGDITG